MRAIVYAPTNRYLVFHMQRMTSSKIIYQLYHTHGCKLSKTDRILSHEYVKVIRSLNCIIIYLVSLRSWNSNLMRRSFRALTLLRSHPLRAARFTASQLPTHLRPRPHPITPISSRRWPVRCPPPARDACSSPSRSHSGCCKNTANARYVNAQNYSQPRCVLSFTVILHSLLRYNFVPPVSIRLYTLSSTLLYLNVLSLEICMSCCRTSRPHALRPRQRALS